MKHFCKELNKSFEDKNEMFKELLKNESLIIDSKKSMIYKSFEKGLNVVTNQQGIEKSLLSESNKGIKFDNDYYYFVVNSSNILDSHLDMHVSGNWNKSVKDQQRKCYLVFDHSLKRSEIIAFKKDIEMFTANVKWELLGKNYEGETYCLIYKVSKNKIVNEDAKKWLEEGHDLEASVRMQYVKIETAFNSNLPEYSKQKSIYDSFYPLIANKEDYSEIDYFWVVKEAKNVMESSLVLFGSNSATGEIKTEENEPTKVTLSNNEPSNDTQTRKKRIFINTQKLN